MPRLGPDQALLVARLWREARVANEKAEQYSRKWNELNDAINVKFDREGDRDIVSRNKRKSASIPLNDAYAAGQWWANEARRLAAAIQTEYLCTLMMQGGETWAPPLSSRS